MAGSVPEDRRSPTDHVAGQGPVKDANPFSLNALVPLTAKVDVDKLAHSQLQKRQ